MAGGQVGRFPDSHLQTRTYAQASLRETLTVMMAEIDGDASVTLPVTTNRLDEATLLANPVLSQALKSAIEALVRAAIAHREGVGSGGPSPGQETDSL